MKMKMDIRRIERPTTSIIKWYHTTTLRNQFTIPIPCMKNLNPGFSKPGEQGSGQGQGGGMILVLG